MPASSSLSDLPWSIYPRWLANEYRTRANSREFSRYSRALDLSLTTVRSSRRAANHSPPASAGMRPKSDSAALMAFLRRPSRMMFLRTERAPRLTDARLSGAAVAFFLSTTGDLKRWLAIKTISWLRTSTRHNPVLATPISRPAQITLSFDLNSSRVMSAVAKVPGSNPSSPISVPRALSIAVSNLSARGLLPPAHFY